MLKSKKTIKLIIAIGLTTAVFCLAFWAFTFNASRAINVKNTTPIFFKSDFQTQKDIMQKDLIKNIATEKSQPVNTDRQAPALYGFTDTVPILMYHYIEIAPATTTLKGLYLDPKIFDNQLQELKNNNYQTLFISELADNIIKNEKIAKNNIVLTFDDGYEDFYTQAFPLLKKYNYKSTLYVIINALDTKGYLTRAQVRELADSGLVEIASHTFNHPDLRNLKNKNAKFEISESKKSLETISGKPVLSFAYPFGLYKPEFFKIISSSGYTSAVSVMAGTRQGTDDQWLLRRLRPNERSGSIFIAWIKDWEKSSY